jgi:hypothetical protein
MEKIKKLLRKLIGLMLCRIGLHKIKMKVDRQERPTFTYVCFYCECCGKIIESGIV